MPDGMTTKAIKRKQPAVDVVDGIPFRDVDVHINVVLDSDVAHVSRQRRRRYRHQ